MKMTTFKKYLLYVLLGSGSLLATSCDDDNEGGLLQPDDVQATYKDGVFVINEGRFTHSDSEISFISRDGKTVVPALFNQVNGRALGDVAQSITVVGDKAYIAVNNSEKIEVVDTNTFKSLGVINGLKIPRYIVALNANKAYVTEYVGYSFSGYTGTGRVSVLDLTNNTVSKTINVGLLPEGILLYNGKLYVANSAASTISVINTSTDVVESTIEVGASPSNLVLDANNKIWALTGAYGQPGTLVKIDPANNAVTSFDTPGSGKLAINGAKNTLIYSANGKIYSMSVNATTAPTSPIISRNPYGLDVDPQTNTIYMGYGAYDANGWVVRYQPTGTPIDSFQVKILPNGFNFR